MYPQTSWWLWNINDEGCTTPINWKCFFMYVKKMNVLKIKKEKYWFLFELDIEILAALKSGKRYQKLSFWDTSQIRLTNLTNCDQAPYGYNYWQIPPPLGSFMYAISFWTKIIASDFNVNSFFGVKNSWGKKNWGVR